MSAGGRNGARWPRGDGCECWGAGRGGSTWRGPSRLGLVEGTNCRGGLVMDNRDKLYIDGAWVASTGTGTLSVIDSTTEEELATVPEGTVEDIDRAVAAARRAFPAWAETSVEERAKMLTRVQEALGTRMDELADMITHEVGMPLTLSGLIQVGLPMNTFGSMAQVANDFTWEQQVGNSLIVREPIGVVGAITLELPTPPDRGQGGPGIGCRVHGGPE